jgi:hypothetical protein
MAQWWPEKRPVYGRLAAKPGNFGAKPGLVRGGFQNVPLLVTFGGNSACFFGSAAGSSLNGAVRADGNGLGNSATHRQLATSSMFLSAAAAEWNGTMSVASSSEAGFRAPMAARADR